MGTRVATAGRHASHTLQSAARCYRVPSELPVEEAVFHSLGSIALQGVRKARVELGEAAASVGLGLVGNLALQLARLQGALPAVGLDPAAGRRAVALACGIDAALDPGDPGAPAALSALWPGRGPSVVIESTGQPHAINEALAIAGDAARVVLLASTRGLTETNFYRDVHKKGLTLLGAQLRSSDP